MFLAKLNNSRETLIEIRQWAEKERLPKPFNDGGLFNRQFRFSGWGFNILKRKISFWVTYIPTGDSKKFYL